MIEFRSAPLEVRGRVISGLALPWGARARIGGGIVETFTRDSFSGLAPVPLRLEHSGPTIGEVVPASSDRGLEVRGEYTEDLGGRDRFSVEFKALAETRSNELRIVHDANLRGLAAVQRPAYSGAEIEVRQRGTYRTSVATGTRTSCKCAASESREVVFEAEAFAEIPDLDIAAISRGAESVIADTATGSLTLTVGQGGALGVALSPLDTPAGRNIEELIEAGVQVYARPLWDPDRSEWELDGDLARVTRAWFAYLLVRPVPAVDAVGLEALSRRENRDSGVRAEASSAVGGESVVATAIQRKRRVWV